MNPKEQEIAIGELEERVDRLRNIYEQYFLGFEKLEPTVPRKDVDRRFAILRKEQIRNTAMRFRFQVVTQKYNTYAMHWVRICRQIEEGTYKRHVRKAKARFGDAARPDAPEREISIDVDMDDFESTDFDSVLAEANASMSTYDRSDTADTVPPPPASSREGVDRARQLLLTTPGTSFAVTGSREVLDEMDPHTPPPSMRGPAGERVARGAPLPAGSKPRILRKRDDTEPPPSGRTLPGAPPASAQMRAAPPPASSPRIAPPPASSPRLPAPSSPGFEGTGPARPRIAPIARPNTAPAGPPPGAASAGRIPVAAQSSQSAGAPGAGRIPVAAPSGGAPSPAPSQRMAAAPPAGASSAGRLPVPAPSAPSAGRLPAGAPARPPGPPSPSSPTAPGRPSGGSPAARPAPPPAGAKPGAPPPKPGAPGPRPPMPSVSDKESSPPSGDGRPSVRPRAPLPLPSQLARPKKDS